MDGFGLLMSSTPSWNLHIGSSLCEFSFYCNLPTAQLALATFQSPQERGSDWSRKSLPSLWDNLLQYWGRGTPPGLLPSVGVQGRNLSEGPVGEASILSHGLVHFARVHLSLKLCAFSDWCQCLVSYSQFLYLLKKFCLHIFCIGKPYITFILKNLK